MFNLTVSGNLAADPVAKESNSGTKVVNFILLTTKKDVTTQFDCALWGTRSETIEKYARKGMKLVISGDGQMNTFTRKDGSPGASIKVKVNDFDLPPKPKSDAYSIPA